MEKITEMYWYNYAKKEYEYITTPTDFSEYIPQNEASLKLYEIYQIQGYSPIEAAKKILEICVGV